MNHIETFYFSNGGRFGTKCYVRRTATHGELLKWRSEL